MEKSFQLDKIKKRPTWDFVSVILVEPSKPQNLGNIARVMMNFGFLNLIIVNPLFDLSISEIKIIARRAEVIIDQIQLVNSYQDIRNKFDFMIGTTARIGSDYNLKRVAITPEQLLKEKLNHKKLAIVFGREQHGLSNEEIELCDLLVTIPTSHLYPVMNLSHAIAVILYFLFQKFQKSYLGDSGPRPKHRAATHRERQQLMEYFNKLIKTTGYHPEKHSIASQAFSNIVSRGYVTGREITTLMGVLKWIDINLQK